jgi:hypothetical protein
MLKTVSSLGNIIGALVYQGTWDASSNTPTLTSSVGNKGDYYYVSVAGSTNLNGITDWKVGDFAVFNGTVWQKIDNTDAVQSVNGQTGIVVLGANDVGATANTTYVLTSGLLSGGGRLNANATITLTSVPVANVPGAVPNTVNVIAGTGLSGGGALTGNVTLAVGTVPVANISGLGTMATQNANAVAITGGTEANVSYSNVSISSGNATLTNITATRVTSNNIIATANTAPSSNVGAIQVGTNSFSDTGVIANFQSNVAGYNQVTIQNTSSASNASAEFIAYNNLGTAATNYATVGINSSTYSGSGSINAPGYGYFLSGSTDMVVGTISANAIHFVANSSPTDAMVVNANNTVTIQALSQSTSASATFATASLPLVPAGYITINLNGTNVKVPYYSV